MKTFLFLAALLAFQEEVRTYQLSVTFGVG